MDLACNDSGAVLVEYALVLALLSLSLMAGMKGIDFAATQALTYVTGELVNYGLRNGS